MVVERRFWSILEQLLHKYAQVAAHFSQGIHSLIDQLIYFFPDFPIYRVHYASKLHNIQYMDVKGLNSFDISINVQYNI